MRAKQTSSENRAWLESQRLRPQGRTRLRLAGAVTWGQSRGILGQDGDSEEGAAAETGVLDALPGCKCPRTPDHGRVGAWARGGRSARGRRRWTVLQARSGRAFRAEPSALSGPEPVGACQVPKEPGET